MLPRMRRSVVLMLLLAACGGPSSAQPSTEPAPSTQGGTAPSGSESCAEGGVLDDGDAEDCEIRFQGCCYAEQSHACAAAGCPPGQCAILESYPGQVACE
jgi:hypothetical protein